MENKTETPKRPRGRDFLVNEHVQFTNDAIGEVRKYNKELYGAVREAYLELKDIPDALDRYKILVDIDRSSINKIIRITEYIPESLLVDLPSSWGSLYALTNMDEEDLVEAVEKEEITRRSTLAEIQDVKRQYKGIKPGEGKKMDKELVEQRKGVLTNCLCIDLEELDCTGMTYEHFRSLLRELYDVGVQVHGIDLYDRKVA